MRLTHSSVAIAQVLMASPSDKHYGYEVSKQSHVRSGVIYPTLDRWLKDGWLEDGWEEQPAQGKRTRPPRRYYLLTDLGRRELGGALQRASADSRFTGWRLGWGV
jgi:PadR family transcriptional regulator PadR